MYTKYCLDVELRNDTPELLLTYIRWLMGEDCFYCNNMPELPEHLSIKNNRFNLVMCNFNGEMPRDKYPRDLQLLENGNYRLQAAANLKNYREGTEWTPIDGFLDMILPFICVPVGTVIGWYEYEEWHEPCDIVYEGKSYREFEPRRDDNDIYY